MCVDIKTLEDINPKIAEFINDKNFVNIAPGRYEVDENYVYVNVEEYYTKTWDTGRFEAHRKYIDVHFVISGEEIISVEDINSLTIQGAYSEEDDIMYFSENIRAKEHLVSPGNFIVLYPDNAHRPCMMWGKVPCKVKKAVFKILIKE
jgi:biofilm protein TabA